MAELADAQDLGSCEAIRVGSTPTTRTSSETPNTVPFPPLAKTALCWEFLRISASTRFAGLEAEQGNAGTGDACPLKKSTHNKKRH